MATYKVIEKIGEGGMGVVYRAQQTTLNRDVALKLLLSGDDPRPNDLARFAREVRAIARITHPNVIRILDYGTIDNKPYYAMEYLGNARTLGDIMRKDGPLPIPRAIAVARQLLDALAAVHRHGLIHRDVKPGNIMVAPDDHLTLMDFGLVKDLEAESMTRTGMMIGTPRYLSPEAVQAEPVDARSDLFAVGVMLHEGISGKRLFMGDTLTALAVQIVNHQPAPLRGERRDCPTWLADLIFRLLAKDPEQRPASALEALNTLRAALGEQPKEDVHVASNPSLVAGEGEVLPTSTILGGMDALRKELSSDSAAGAPRPDATPPPSRPRTTRKTGSQIAITPKPPSRPEPLPSGKGHTMLAAAGMFVAVFAITLAAFFPRRASAPPASASPASPAGTTPSATADSHPAPSGAAATITTSATIAEAEALGSAITSLAPEARTSALRNALHPLVNVWFKTPPDPRMVALRQKFRADLEQRAARAHLTERITAFIPLRGEYFTSPAVSPVARLATYQLINDLLDLELFCDRFEVPFSPGVGRALHASYGQTTAGALEREPAAGYAFSDGVDGKGFRPPADPHSARWTIADVKFTQRFHGPGDPEATDMMRTLGAEGNKDNRDFEAPEPLPIPLAQVTALELSGWSAGQEANNVFEIQLSDGAGWRTVAIVRGMSGDDPRRWWHTVDRALFTGSRLSLRARFRYQQDMIASQEFAYLFQVQVHYR